MKTTEKQKLENGLDVLSGELVEKRFEKFKRKIIDRQAEIPLKTLRHLKTLLSESKDNIDFIESISRSVSQQFISTLLTDYEGCSTSKDRLIYDILFLLERVYRIPLRPFKPIVWGAKSKTNYENLRAFGQTLHTRLTSDQVFDYLDPRQMWFTLLKLDNLEFTNATTNRNNQEMYDYRFVLRVLTSILEPPAELSSRKFVECNALSFAFAATSLKEPSERALAYVILRRFLSHLSDLSVETFAEKSLFIYLIRFFKNSVDYPNQRIPHVVSHFFARTTKLLLNAADPLYAPIMSFLVLKPTVDIENVPEFYKLFLSSTVQYHHKERQWILTLIADSLIEPYDYNVLQKRYVIKLCLSLFTSNMSTMETRKLVLIILRSALKHQSVAKDLFYRSNLQSWITVTAQQSTLSRWEKVFLCQLFITLYEHIKTFMMNETNQNDIKSKNQIALQQKICQMLSGKMKQILDEVDDSGKAVWSTKLDDLISSDWSEKEVVENDNA